MSSLAEKDESIQKVVARLRRDLGESAFDIVDHWDVDPFAIGLGSPHDHQTLAYVSTYKLMPGEFSYELELPPKTDSDEIYTVAGETPRCDYDALADALRRHLQLDGAA